MKKFILSLSFIGLLSAYALSRNGDDVTIVPSSGTNSSSGNLAVNTSPEAAASGPQKNPPPTSAPSSNPAPKPTPTPTPAPSPVSPPKPKGQYTDGTYTGNVADAYYGNVQVKAIIQNGKIADVQFLDYPQDRSTSRYINSQAMPYLTQEAIQAQSANVDIVSGATFTSQAFQQSLADALSQAKA